MTDKTEESKIEKKRRLTKARVTKFYQKNKEKILEKRKETINCDLCGRPIKRAVISNHKRTAVCRDTYNYLKNKYNTNTSELTKTDIKT
jgi:hypothetical protein